MQLTSFPRHGNDDDHSGGRDHRHDRRRDDGDDHRAELEYVLVFGRYVLIFGEYRQ